MKDSNHLPLRMGDSTQPSKNSEFEYTTIPSDSLDAANNEPIDGSNALANDNLKCQNPSHEIGLRLDSAVRK